MKLRTYRHSFDVPASLLTVAAFHQNAGSMAAITPPPIIVQIHRAPRQIREGDEMEFTLWLGPLPLRWLARMENVSEHGFIDRQVRGPFAQWTHKHTFISLGDHHTQVVDEVQAVCKNHPLWGLVGLSMWWGLPLLFAYRAWRTRRLLRPTSSPADKAGNRA